MSVWVFTEGKDVSFEHCGQPAYWEGEEVFCSKCQEQMPESLPCNNCGKGVDSDIHAEELGFCVPCSEEFLGHAVTGACGHFVSACCDDGNSFCPRCEGSGDFCRVCFPVSTCAKCLEDFGTEVLNAEMVCPSCAGDVS